MSGMRQRIKPVWIIVSTPVVLIVGVQLWTYFGPASHEPERQVDDEIVAPELPGPREHERPEPAPDPRLTYRGPFKNVDPGVAYVSDTECGKCHAEIAKTFSQHPMARTLTPIEHFASPPLDAQSNNPFSAFGQEFEVIARPDRVIHTRQALDQSGNRLFQSELEVQFAVGSGARGNSFLSSQGSTFLQTPLTWYPQKKAWGLSPGFHPEILAGRRVGADCLFCHSNGANEDPQDETKYNRPVFPNGHGIGCQRCHGPGDEHVRNPGLVETGAGSLDPTIVNPARLSPALREAVCWQCHLEGATRVLRRGRQRFDFRPGMPLHEFINIFEEPDEEKYDNVVNHVEQMWQSRCYQKSAGSDQMGCISCHDPHEAPSPEGKVAIFRSACLKCHQEQGCSLELADRLSKSKDDSCVSCHMPTFSAADVVHVSSTDHRIPRVASPPKAAGTPHQKKKVIQKLVSVFEQNWDKDDPELNRDRALASGMLARQGRYMAQPLIKEFEQAIQRDPTDLAVKAQFARELINRGKADQARPFLEDLLAREPNHESGGYAFALVCSFTNRNQESLAVWRRLIELAPSHFGYRLGLCEALMKEGMFEEAAHVAKDWIAYDPGHPSARMVLRDSLFKLGKTAEANEQHRIYTELVQGLSSP